MKKPKFNIGDEVIALVDVQGSYEPTWCRKGEVIVIDKVEKSGNTYYYIGGYDGYRFKENELKKK